MPSLDPNLFVEAKAEIVTLESILEEAGILASTSLRQFEEFQESLAATWSEFQDELRRNVELLEEQGPALAELEKRLTDRIQDVEDELREKEELLNARDAEIEELRAKIPEGEIPTAGTPPREDGLDSGDESLVEENQTLKKLEKKMREQISALEAQLRVQQQLLEIREGMTELKSHEAIDAETPDPLREEKNIVPPASELRAQESFDAHQAKAENSPLGEERVTHAGAEEAIVKGLPQQVQTKFSLKHLLAPIKR